MFISYIYEALPDVRVNNTKQWCVKDLLKVRREDCLRAVSWTDILCFFDKAYSQPVSHEVKCQSDRNIYIIIVFYIFQFSFFCYALS